MAATVTETDRIRRVLELELSRGCDDRSVIGGLDGMLIRMAEDNGLPAGHPLRRRLGALPARGYRSLGEDERRRWLRETITAISPATPEASAAQPAPAPARRPRSRSAPAAAKAREPAKPRTGTRSKAAGAGSSPGPLTADSPVTRLPGVTAVMVTKFERLGVTTAGDLVRLFPRRFNDFSEMRKIRDLEPAATPLTVVAKVVTAGEIRFGRRVKGSEATLTDGTGLLRVTWFNMPYIARGLHEGDTLVVSGKVRLYRGRLQMENPEFEPLDDELMHTGRLVPVYPATQGLGQRTIRRAVKAALDALSGEVPDPIPAWQHDGARLAPIGEAIRTYHYPETSAAAEHARRRLALGEFLAIQLAVLIRRAEWQDGATAPGLSLAEKLAPFLASLPFPLTGSQSAVLDEILRDIRGPRPMLRLLQGDVGSGKTVVALAAMLSAVYSGHQAVMMAPTEILAEQHYKSIAKFLGGAELSALDGVFMPAWLGRPIRMILVTGSLTAKQKDQMRADAEHGGADILVGTHALLEDSVLIPRLGLAVIDEQHRFGVMQRAKLRQKGTNPHLLVMTATPIPRTLALTVYGDLEVSTIDEMPPGRLPIITDWVHPHERDDAYAFVRGRLDAGEQAFVICPLVEDSEALDVRSAEEEFERLGRGPFRDYRLALLHGRMPGRQKDEVMERFARHEVDVLVSTSVVEVGIDVPNATVMQIEGSERFGLSQLHQFRGRVGRSAKQSWCFLFSTDEDPGPDARARLEAMVETNDGFRLAEVDLEMRGEGEAWGRVQSGSNGMLRVAKLTDRDLLLQAREMASAILERDAGLAHPQHRALASAVRPFLERATEAN